MTALISPLINDASDLLLIGALIIAVIYLVPSNPEV